MFSNILKTSTVFLKNSVLVLNRTQLPLSAKGYNQLVSNKT